MEDGESVSDDAGNASFLYEPGDFGLLDEIIGSDDELRRPKTLTMQQVPQLVHEVLGHTALYTDSSDRDMVQ